MTVAEAFSDIAEILAKMNPSEVADLRPSEAMSNRVKELIFKKKDGEINEEEATELERYLSLDLLINLAKARAKSLLT